jgi:hypothetical protein
MNNRKASGKFFAIIDAKKTLSLVSNITGYFLCRKTKKKAFEFLLTLSDF